MSHFLTYLARERVENYAWYWWEWLHLAVARRNFAKRPKTIFSNQSNPKNPERLVRCRSAFEMQCFRNCTLSSFYLLCCRPHEQSPCTHPTIKSFSGSLPLALQMCPLCGFGNIVRTIFSTVTCTEFVTSLGMWRIRVRQPSNFEHFNVFNRFEIRRMF